MPAHEGQQAMHFTLTGMFYGYPVCCTADMIERWKSLVLHGEPIDAFGRPLGGTGFVPCPVCSATYTDEEMVLRINAHRSCPTPFPDGNHAKEDSAAYERYCAQVAERLRTAGYGLDPVLGPLPSSSDPSLHPTGAAV